MAVLVEAISVIVQAEAIEKRFRGGWDAFRAAVPNRTLCADGEIARIGFMTPDDVKSFVSKLEGFGLHYLAESRAQDIVVVDQHRGPMAECDWIEFGHVTMAGAHRVAACRLKGSECLKVVTPDGWKYEASLSQTYSFVPNGSVDRSLTFLRHEDGLDVYLSALTGKEVFVGRTSVEDSN